MRFSDGRSRLAYKSRVTREIWLSEYLQVESITEPTLQIGPWQHKKIEQVKLGCSGF